MLQAAREWYLFPELLPANVDRDAFATAEDLLDHLTATARAEGKDRSFSYLTTRTIDNAGFGLGEYVGFGFLVRDSPGHVVHVTDVFEGSPAIDAGMQRGDRIVAIDAGNGFVSVEQLLSGGTLADALGADTAGVTRGLRLERDGGLREVSVAKRVLTIDPVPDASGTLVLPLAGTTGVGYVHLRSYISTADAQLRDAFGQFRARGVDYFIVDLRYNGGGLVSISELLGDLLGGDRSGSDVFSRTTYNASKTSQNRTREFRSQPQSVRPVRIAFLTTGQTASASEISINSMSPWVEIAIVGGDTYGKPVGQTAFDMQGCDDRLRLIAFRTDNARNEGSYYDGLAARLHFACEADDTLRRPFGDSSDPVVGEALHWIATGTCTRTMSAATVGEHRVMGGEARESLPRPLRAVDAWLPGAM